MLPILTAPLIALLIAPVALALAPAQDRDPELAPLSRTESKLVPTRQLVAIEATNSQLAIPALDAWGQFIASQQARGPWTAQVDSRSGLIEIAEGAGVPWVPGAGNRLQPGDLAAYLNGRVRPDITTLESIARDFVVGVEPLLGTEGRTLRLNRGASGAQSDYLWFVEFDVYTGSGLKIEDARVFFRVNNGNLIQFGAERLPAPRVEPPAAALDEDQALAAMWEYVDGPRDYQLVERAKTRLLVVDSDPGNTGFLFGDGYELLPVWEFVFRREGRNETWRTRVDAVTGAVVDFRDINRYAQVTGGYWPVSWRVGGVEQPQVITGWPFTTVNPTGGTSNTSGVYAWDGSAQTARHLGPYVAVNDNCTGAPGTATSDGSGNLAFGEISVPNAPGDCQIQDAINDNTPAARQQYWHLNKIKEKGRTYLPANTWLQGLLTANVNINSNCNAFWNGSTVNFYTSGGGCGNTGEDAGIALHEWAHGMDSNDGNGGSIDNGTGETYGDFSAALQTLDSCTGWGFLGGNCGGYGNACTNCDGVRDINWGRHANNAPMTVASFTQPLCPSDGGGGYNGPCGNGAPQPDDKEGHCESYVSSGALWDLAAADLRSGCTGRNADSPDYDCPGAGGPYSSSGAWQTVDRLWYESRPTANQAFTCFRTSPTWTSDGCNAGSNWRTFRAVDDDDGNLANGTPHACQIAAAFNRHGIGNTPGSSCAADNTTCFRACPQPAAPTLNAPSVGNNQLTLDWTPNPSPDVIDIYRNEVSCTAGFTKIAEDASGTLFVDNQVANGTTYYYQIVRQPVGNESCGSAPSACVSGTPAAGPSAKYVSDSASLVSVPVDNDADGFVDNCESGRMQVGIVNDGAGTLNNVSFTVTSPDSEVTIATAMPVNVGSLTASSLTSATFDFDLDGAVCLQTLDFDISVTADEMTGSSLDSFTHDQVEQDLAPTPSRTDDFESGSDDWVFAQGYVRENVTAASGVWSVHSSSGLDDQLDAALSPIFQKGAGATSVVMAVRYDIEAPFWDRANVHAVNLGDNSHTLLTPTGRTYTAGGPWNPVGHVGTQPGWAGTDLAWGDATFDLSGLNAGESYQLEINHNTDSAVVGTGHWFDNVRWTNVSFQVCDGQTDLCVPCTPPAAPTGLTADVSTANQISLSWNAVAPAPSAYRIYRSTAPGGPYAQVGTVGGGTLNFDDTGLAPGVTYYYVVTAFELCESDDSNEASALAYGDCTAGPTFGGLQSVAQISAGGSCGLRLEWSGGTSNCGAEPLVYNLYRSTTQGFVPGPGNLLTSCVTTESYDDTSIIGGNSYYYVVRAEDAELSGAGACRDGNEDGNSSESSSSVSGGTEVLLFENFDALAAGGLPTGWLTGAFSGSNDWRGARACAGQSAPNVLRYGSAASCTGDYTTNSDAVAITAPIAIPAGSTNVELDFHHRWEFEDNWDGGILYASSADLFPTLLPIGPTYLSGQGYNDLSNSKGLETFGNEKSAGYDAGTMQNTIVDLSQFCTDTAEFAADCAGETLYVGFNGFSDSTITRDGWHIDDVEVRRTGTACSVAPDAVQFLTATASDSQNQVEWRNSGAGAYGSTMIRWSTTDFPADPASGTLLVDQNDGLGGTGNTIHGSVANDTTYFYSAFVDNGSGEYSARKIVAARPFDTSGDVRWEYSTGASDMTRPGAGSVFVVSNDRVLHSIDTGNGSWPGAWVPANLNDAVAEAPLIVPIPLFAATKVAFVGSRDGRVYAFDADTGQQLWASADLGGPVSARPAGIFTVFGGVADLIMVGTRNATGGNTFHGIDVADGTIAWSFTNTIAQGGDDLDLGAVSSEAVIDSLADRVYFASRRDSAGSLNTVWSLDFTGNSASLRWARDIGDVNGAFSLEAGRVYAGTESGKVYALDAADGSDSWISPYAAGDGPIKGRVAPRIGTSELLFSTANNVWSISDDGASSSLNWSVAAIPAPSTPAVSPGAPLAWVGGGDGTLYELELGVGPPTITPIVLGDGAAGIGNPTLDDSGNTLYAGSAAGRLYAITTIVPPMFAKAFAPDAIYPGGTSTLTFTIDNSGSDDAASGIAFTDTLPTDMIVATPNGASNTCGGSLTAVAGAGSISLSGGSVSAASSCTISVDVTSAAAGSYLNTTDVLTSSSGSSGTASDTLNVDDPPTFGKAFSPATIFAGATSTLGFVIDNSASNQTASNLAFTDTLPGTVVVAATPSASTTCVGGTLTADAGTGTISYSGGSAAAGASCTVMVDVTSATAGSYVNTSGALTSSAGSSGTASDTLTVDGPPGFAKVFSPDTIFAGGTSTLTFTVDNSGSTQAATALAFTDALPGTVVVAATPNASTTCVGGTLTADAGTGTISYSGGSVAAGASCTVMADVTSATAGSYVNTSGALTSSAGSSGTASDTLTVDGPPGFAKVFSPDTIFAGGTSTLTFTVNNSGSTQVASALAFTDSLPGTVVVAATPSASTTCVGGTLTADAGTGTISYSGGSAAAGASCTVMVDVTSATAGSYVNTSGALTSSAGSSGTASDTLTVDGPPGFAKVFSPDTIFAGGTSTLTFTVNNSGSTQAASALAFSDTLPSGVVVAATPNASTNCVGGTLTADAGTGTISYSAGSVAAGASCTISVDVTAVTAGSYVNTSGALTSSAGSSGTASDTLTVDGPPGFAKVFSPDTIFAGGTSTLTFTVNNSASTQAASALAFIDTLPGTVVVAPTPNASTTCVGGTLTADAGTGTISYSAGSVAAGASCTISVDVTAVTSGSYVNTTGALTSSAGSSGTASDTLTVDGPPGFAKVFSPDTIFAGGTSTLTFTVNNSGSTQVASALAFTDSLPGTVVVAATPSASTTCVGGTLTADAGTATIDYSAGSVAAGASCTISVEVTAVTSGSYVNTTGALTSSAGSSGTASDTLTVDGPPSFAKVFSPDTIFAGGTSTLTFTIDNTGSTQVASALAFSDTLPGTVVVAATPNASTTCVGGTLTADAGTGTISYSGGSIGAGGSCSVSVDVTAVTSGSYVNTTGALTSSAGSSGTASDTLTVDGPPGLAKVFGPDTIFAGGTSTLTFTVNNSASTQAASALAFIDTLPGTVVVAPTPNASTTCVGGTLTADAGTGTISYSAGSVAAGGSCTVSVDVTAVTAGSYVNTSGTLTSSAGSSGTASDTLTVDGPPTFVKEFAPETIFAGSTSTLTFTVNNSASTQAASALAFIDTLPGTVVVAATPNASTNCVGGTLTADAGTATIDYSAGSVAAGGICTISVDVTAVTAGSYVNTSGALTSSAGSSGTASDTLTVDGPPGLAKVFSPDTIFAGGTSTLTFTVDNTGSTQVASALAFSDTLPGTVVVAATPNASTNCVGGTLTADAGTATIDYSAGSVAAGGICTISVDVTAVTSGSYVNTTGALTSSAGSSGTASDTLTVDGPPSFAKVFSPDTIFAGGTSTLTFTVNNSGSTQAASALAFTDALPGTVVVAATPNASTTCVGGTLTADAGTATIDYSAGSVAAGGICTISVDVTAVTSGSYVNTTGALTSSAGSSGTASDTLTVDGPPTFVKEFAPETIFAGSTSTLTFTIDNSASNQAASSLVFTDTMPSGVVVATPSGATNTCGGTLTAADGTGSVSFSGGSVGAGASCTISVDVTAVTAGSYVNTSDALTSSAGSSGTASDTLTVDGPPGFAKVFSPDTIFAGGTSTLTFTVDNSASAQAASTLAFTDTLPASVVVAATPNASTTCGGILTATAGSGSISLSAGTVAAGASCTVQADVTSSTSGSHVNTSDALTSSAGSSGTASDTLTVDGPPTFAKAFGPDTIFAGGTSTLTFSIDNSASAQAASALAFIDTLPTGMIVETPNNANNTCGGTFTAVAGSSSISLSAGTVNAGASCTISVDVTAAGAGSYDNTSGDLSSSAGNSGTASAILTVAEQPSFSLAFAPNAIAAGGISTLTFTIDNAGATLAISSLAFSNSLPTVIQIANPNGAVTTCAGTVTAAPGGNLISFTGGTIAASSSCDVSIDVTSSSAGAHVNTTGDLTSDAGTSGTATDTLTVEGPPAFAKAFDPPAIASGDISTLTFTIDNSGSSLTATDLAFIDNLPAGMAIASPSGAVDNCGGTLSAADGAGTISYADGSVDETASCTVEVNVTSLDPGTYLNTTGTLDSSAGPGETASDTLTVGGVITVTGETDLVAADGICSLREAIDNANYNGDVTSGDCIPGFGADTIVIPPGTYGLALAGADEDFNASGDLDITDPAGLLILGAGPRETIIDGTALDRVLDVHPGVPLNLQGVTVQNGSLPIGLSKATHLKVLGDGGGGIRSEGELALTRVRVRDNHSPGSGGGLLISGGTATIRQSLVDANQAHTEPGAAGGGIAVSAASGTVVTLENSTLSGNSAVAASGGALSLDGGATVSLSYVTVTANSSGLAQSGSASLSLTGSIVTGNGFDDCSGTVNSGGYNVLGSSSSIWACPASPSDVLPISDAAALIQALLNDNGGPTDTHALPLGSPAVNLVPLTVNNCGSAGIGDQRGMPRPDDSACDAGAYEGFLMGAGLIFRDGFEDPGRVNDLIFSDGFE